jgi:hypothetical protein
MWLARNGDATRAGRTPGSGLRREFMRNAVVAVVSVMVSLAVVAGGTVALWSGRAESSPTSDAGTSPGASGSGVAASESDAALPTVDGVVYAGEYANSLYDPQTGMSLFWRNDSINLYVGLISPGTGWLGVGFSDHRGKPGSNIILGAVSNGMVTVQDNYGVTKELHLADRTSSLLTIGGSEGDGETTIEFVIPLAGGDSQDTALTPGQTVQVILAYQATRDSFTAEHTRYSMTQITLDL